MPTRLVALLGCLALSACYLPTSIAMTPAAPSPGSLAYMDAKAGFRGARVGMAVSDIAGLTALGDEAGLQMYRREESMTLGNGVLSSIRYGFKNGRLVTISLTADGVANSAALLEAFQAAYGVGYKPNRFLKDYFWSGQAVQTIYSQRPGTNDSWLTISDKAFVEQELKNRANKSANADL